MGLLDTKLYQQKCVYWRRTGTTSTNQPIFAAAVELDCRWEDSTEEYTDSKGETKLSRSLVMVKQDLVIGSALREGLLSQLTNLTKPYSNSNTFEINRFDKIPDLDAEKFLRIAYL